MTASVPQRAITDPVVMFDSMWEAANSLRGRLLWLKRHAETSAEAEQWFAEYLQVRRDRTAVSATDMDAQHEALVAFRTRERELEHLISA